MGADIAEHFPSDALRLRESEVLRMIAQASSNEAVAANLAFSGTLSGREDNHLDGVHERVGYRLLLLSS